MDFILRDMLVERGIPVDETLDLVKLCSLSVHRLKGILRSLETVQVADTAEIGCKNGGTSRMMALTNNGRRHWACDTFCGLVDCDSEIDGRLTNGRFAAPRKEAEKVLCDLDNVTIIEGIFPQSATEEMKSATFGVVHIDVDTYRSTLASFEFFATRMVPNGLIILDDVLWPGPPGAIQALDELLAANRVTVIEKNPPQAIVRLVA